MTEATKVAVTEEQKAEILEAEKARVIDRSIRYARENDYCNATRKFFVILYGGNEDDFYDSDGMDCVGNTREQVERRRALEEAQRRAQEEERRTYRQRRDMIRSIDRSEHLTGCWCGETHTNNTHVQA